ncbi:MaoC family dehydratase [Robiginitomaculum antarcticum]|uniref:MaoC family dehydratase n=1 Tax=Robiginitomaculum antarcticum TaxID=437507 RepID=UPI00035CF1B9|nr:MaoC family dehydratase [Robiginitomaculum antarcticum]
MKTVKASELQGMIGSDIGTSDWITVSQDRINRFAEVTEDHQFIHVNEAAAKMTPFGGTIAHGFLTLSLLSKFSEGAGLVIEGVKMGVNYGFEKVRFINPVPSGSKVRGHFKLKDAVEKKPGQHLLTYEITVEIEGVEKPALIADWLGMQFTG